MILLVDDNKDIVSWLEQVIQEAGYYFDHAIDAQSALYKMSRIYYALALVDINLEPGITGEDLAKIVKGLPDPYCSTPMIAITGGMYELPEDKTYFVDILRKPFLPRDLRAAIMACARPPIKDLHLTRVAVESDGPIAAAASAIQGDSVSTIPEGPAPLIEQDLPRTKK